MKTVEELKEFLSEFELEDCLYFSEEETISAIIGFEDSERCLVYDYDKLITSFVEHFRKYDKESKTEEELYEEALEWVEYNTIRSLPYKQHEYIVRDDSEKIVETFYRHEDAEKKVDSLGSHAYIEEIALKSPIIIHNIETYGF